MSYQVSGLVPSIDFSPLPPKFIRLINMVAIVISGIRSCTSYLTSVPFLPNAFNWKIWLSMSYQVSGLVPLIWPLSPSSQMHSIERYGCHCHIRYQVLYLLFDLRPIHPKVVQLKIGLSMSYQVSGLVPLIWPPSPTSQSCSIENMVVIVISGIRSCTSYCVPAPPLKVSQYITVVDECTFKCHIRY